MIPGQSIAEAVRQRQHPLAHRHPREHFVDEVGGAFSHPSPPTTRTKAAPLAGEGQEALEGAVGAAQPREAVGQGPAREELAELLLNEAGQPVAVAPVGGLPQEGLQMFADDGVEDGVLGVARLIRAMGMRHALG